MPDVEQAIEASRVEFFEDPSGPIVYIAVDPDGTWARSAFPDELLTLDYDDQDRLIGMEIIGDLAKAVDEKIVKLIIELSAVQPELLLPALRGDSSDQSALAT